MREISYNRGYTLIEALVYTAILAVVSLFVIGSIISINSSVVSVRISRNINRSALVAVERMAREIREAKSINTTINDAPYIGNVSEALAINTLSASNTPIIRRFYRDESDKLLVADHNSVPSPILGSDLRVSNLTFYKLTASSSQAVRLCASFWLTAARSCSRGPARNSISPTVLQCRSFSPKRGRKSWWWQRRRSAASRRTMIFPSSFCSKICGFKTT